MLRLRDFCRVEKLRYDFYVKCSPSGLVAAGKTCLKVYDQNMSKLISFSNPSICNLLPS